MSGTSSAARGAAAVLGYAAGRVLVVGRSLPGAAGGLLVAYGMFEAWRPLGFIAAGGFLLLVDRRTL